MTHPLHLGRVLTGSESGQSQPDKDIPEILRALGEEKIDWRGFVSHKADFASINKAISEMRGGAPIHTLLEIPVS